MKVINENGTIKVQSDYNADFVKRAKLLQGRWSKPYWVFPGENEAEVKALLMDIYGENGDEQETVDLLIDLGKMENGQTVRLGGYVLAYRYSRDSMVRLGDNVILVSGNFDESGGSTKYPRVNADDGTIVKAKGVPMSLYERYKNEDYIKVAVDEDDRKAKLMAEKERLLARLAEIETELAQ